MRLNFRQGVVRHQTDVSGNPTFLQRSSTSEFIDLVVSPDPTVLAFAHGVADYIVEETRSVQQAWGPLTGSGDKYLYWDLDLLSAALRHGITLLSPIYTSSAPVSPVNDQYWFSTVDNTGRVWNGSRWIEKLRVFAGTVTSNSIIRAAAVGSQAGILADIEAGHVILDSYGAPLRQSNGTFVTTTTWLNIINLGTTTARLEEQIMSGMAAEELPMYSLVQLRRGKQLLLARCTDHNSRVSGIVRADLYTGEVSTVVTTGVVKNSLWAFTDDQINRPLFCGPTGQVTLSSPRAGVSQQIGFVYDTNAIYLDIKHAVILDDPFVDSFVPPVIVPLAPVADFTTSIVTGTAPLTVKFTNTSVNAQRIEWDFTNTGFSQDTVGTPSYVYETPGIYSVRLKAFNAVGVDQVIKTNLITVNPPVAGPTDVNLGISFGAPAQIVAGRPVTFQIISSNSGRAAATSVRRKIHVRSDNGTDVTVIAMPTGATANTVNGLTEIILAPVDIASGAGLVDVVQIIGSATEKSIEIEGTINSLQVNSSPNKSSSTLTITVKQ